MAGWFKRVVSKVVPLKRESHEELAKESLKSALTSEKPLDIARHHSASAMHFKLAGKLEESANQSALAARAYGEAGKMKEAVEHFAIAYQQRKEFAEDLHSQRRENEALHQYRIAADLAKNAGTISHKELLDIEGAVKHFEAAAVYNQAANNEEGVADMLAKVGSLRVSLAQGHEKKEELEKALHHYSEAATNYSKTKQSVLASYLYDSAVDIAVKLKRPEEVRRFRALAKFEHEKAARKSELEGKPLEAAKHWADVAKNSAELGGMSDAAKAAMEAGRNFDAAEQPDQALGAYERAVDHAAKTKSYAIPATILQRLKRIKK